MTPVTTRVRCFVMEQSRPVSEIPNLCVIYFHIVTALDLWTHRGQVHPEVNKDLLARVHHDLFLRLQMTTTQAMD